MQSQLRSHRAKSRCPSGWASLRWVSRLRSTRMETEERPLPTPERTSTNGRAAPGLQPDIGFQFAPRHELLRFAFGDEFGHRAPRGDGADAPAPSPPLPPPLDLALPTRAEIHHLHNTLPPNPWVTSAGDKTDGK